MGAVETVAVCGLVFWQLMPASAADRSTAGATLSSAIAAPAPPVMKPMHVIVPPKGRGGGSENTVSPAVLQLFGYIPCDLYNAYYLASDTHDGAGTTIAIVDAFDQPNIVSDLNTFDAQFSLPGPPGGLQIHRMGAFASGFTTADWENWELETTLDVEWAHALAPGAALILVQAVSPNGSDMNAAVSWAVSAAGGNADIVSLSYNGPEYSGETSDDSTFPTSTGKLFFAAAGDAGTGATWPSASPAVISVGGTTLGQSATGDPPNSLRASNTSCPAGSWGATGSNETVWAGGGGGISSQEGIPQYEVPLTSAYSSSKRSTPDVAALGDPNSGVSIYISHTYTGTGPTSWTCCVGGTSLAAPIWTGIAARGEQARGSKLSIGAGYASSPTYTAPSSSFTDIATGSNGTGAGTGYDLASGRGSPKGFDFALAGDTLVVTTSASSVGAGGALNVTVTANKPGTTTPDTSFSGQVRLSSSDPQAQLPSAFTFSGASHTFTGAVLKTAGSQTFTATDITTGGLPGTSPAVTVSPGPATRLQVSVGAGFGMRGVPFNAVVTALDQFGNRATSYSGTVHWTTGDPGAGLPPDGALSNGTQTFSITPSRVGSETYSTADVNSPTINGSLNLPISAPTRGYSILTNFGGIYNFGTAQYWGNLLDHGYPGPAIGLGETVTGQGYDILTTFGGIYTFGDAQYYGNLLDHGYPGPAVAMAMTPTGKGYLILTSWGGIYTFGDAQYYGNLVDHGYPGPAVSISMTPSGKGYAILTSWGGIYTFGDAQYYGNLVDHHYPGPAVSLSYTGTGQGYEILTSFGGIYTFGDARYFGNLLDHGYPGPAVCLANTP